MPDAETGTGSGEVARMRAEIKDEITKADTAQKRAELAQRLLQELKDAETPAKEFVKELKRGNANEKRDEGKQVKRALIRAAEAAKEGVNVTTKANAQKILVELADKSLTDTTASAIENNLKDYLYGNKDITFSSAGQPKSQFEEAFDQLKQTDSTAAETVGEVLVEQSTQLGQTQDVIRDKFKVETEAANNQTEARNNQTEEQRILNELHARGVQPGSEEERALLEQWKRGRGGEGGGFESDKQNFYEQRFKTPEDLKLLESLYDKKKFLRYVKINMGSLGEVPQDEVERKNYEEANKIRAELTGKGLTEDQIDKRVRELAAKGIETRIINMLDRVHVALARSPSKESYQEISSKDYFHGIAVTIQAMTRAIQGLQQSFAYDEQNKVNEIVGLKLFRTSESKLVPETVDIEGTKIKKTFLRMQPMRRPAEISLSEFAKYLEIQINRYVPNRGYLHDVNTIFNSPGGEHGFWGGLSGYAEKLAGNDLDAILSLPDGSLVLEAYQLYQKYLEEQFALQDWRHDPNMFSAQEGSNLSQLEEEVLQGLTISHPDMDIDRLTSALYMGKGLARGVLLTEPEVSGYADPPLTPSGGGAFTSYYTNDATSLMVFNPMHLFVRWQGEANLPAWLFTPLDEKSLRKTKFYNHKDVYNDIIKFRNSYWEGREKMHGKKLLIDDLVDFGNVGGPAKRRGWRMLWAAQDFFEFEKNEQGNITHTPGFPQEANPKEDILKTWQSIEKIGWEVVFDFVANDRIDRALLTNKEYTGKREEFFKYLFKTYFGQDESQLENYLKNIRGNVRGEVLKSVRDGKSHPTSIDDQIELETSNTFLYRTLSRFIAKRFPSKILKITRDRFENDGVSRWHKVFYALQKDNAAGGWDLNKFDKTMKNLALAEGLLRKNVSELIKERMRDESLKLYNLSDIKHELTADKIRDLLNTQIAEATRLGKSINITGREVNDVITLFEKMNSMYTGSTPDAKDFLDKYASIMHKDKDNFYTFTYGIEDTDISLMLFKRAGPRVIPRVVGDIAQMDQHMMVNGVLKLNDVLRSMAIGEKAGDFSPIINVLKEVYTAYTMVHGPDAGYEAVHKLAAAAITYFRKDDLSQGLLGIFGIGGRHSIAAEEAGRSSGVHEWDGTDIDKFVIQLESNGLLKKNAYNLSIPARYEPVYFTIPFLNKSIKVGARRIKDYPINGHSLREKYGGNWTNILYSFAAKYGPLFLAFMLWKFMKDSYDEVQGKKK